MLYIFLVSILLSSKFLEPLKYLPFNFGSAYPTLYKLHKTSQEKVYHLLDCNFLLIFKVFFSLRLPRFSPAEKHKK